MAIPIIMNLELCLVETGFLILEGMGFEIGGICVTGRQSFVVSLELSILSYISATGLASVIILGSVLWLAR
ncbi:hypothetical protein LguiA_018452 [Lonicera macranthoides]